MVGGLRGTWRAQAARGRAGGRAPKPLGPRVRGGRVRRGGLGLLRRPPLSGPGGEVWWGVGRETRSPPGRPLPGPLPRVRVAARWRGLRARPGVMRSPLCRPPPGFGGRGGARRAAAGVLRGPNGAGSFADAGGNPDPRPADGGGGGGDVRLPGGDRPVDVPDHQHFLLEQGDLSEGADFKFIRCKSPISAEWGFRFSRGFTT